MNKNIILVSLLRMCTNLAVANISSSSNPILYKLALVLKKGANLFYENQKLYS